MVGLAICLLAATSAKAQYVEDWDESPSTGQPQEVDTGYVFINGEYLEAPYLIELAEEGVLVNDVLIKAEQFPKFAPGMRRGVAGGREPDWRGNIRQGASWQAGDVRQPFMMGSFRRTTSPLYLQRRIVHRLEEDSAIIAFDDRPFVVIESGDQVDQLLKHFVRRDLDAAALENLLGILAPADDHDHWKQWLATYEPPDQLVSRACDRVEQFEAVASANQAEVAAVRRIDQFSYPLSLIGMVLAVVASGHLLQSAPARHDHQPPLLAQQSSPYMMRFVLIAAALVLALSMLDLAWTVLAAQAGQMRELNPLGRGLIDDPMMLAAFKLSATLLSCGLLVALRRYHCAQVASWWLCLVCTILTYRWLTFNSMFMGS